MVDQEDRIGVLRHPLDEDADRADRHVAGQHHKQEESCDTQDRRRHVLGQDRREEAVERKHCDRADHGDRCNALDVAHEVDTEGQLGQAHGEDDRAGNGREEVSHDHPGDHKDDQQAGGGGLREALNEVQQPREEKVEEDDEAQEPFAQQVGGLDAEHTDPAVDAEHRPDHRPSRGGVERRTTLDDEEVDRAQQPGDPEHRVDTLEALPVEAAQIDGTLVGVGQGRAGDDEEERDAEVPHVQTEGLVRQQVASVGEEWVVEVREDNEEGRQRAHKVQVEQTRAAPVKRRG